MMFYLRRFLSIVVFVSALLTIHVQASHAQITPADYAEYLMRRAQELPNANTTPRGDRKFRYEEGNNILAIAALSLRDYAKHVIEFYAGGMRYQVIGMCIKCGSFGCSFWPYVRYHFPYMMVEIADQYQSQYVPDFLMKALRDATDEFWYDTAETLTPFDVALITGQDVDEPDISAIEDVQKSRRLRVWGSALHGRTRNEFQLMSPLAPYMSLPQIPTGNCHDVPPPQVLARSDNPVYITFAHLVQMSHLLFPAETAMFTLNPTACVGHNISTGVSPVWPFASVSIPIEQKKLCLAMHGNIYPTTATQSSSRSFGNSAYLGAIRAFRLFRQLPMTAAMTNDFANYQIGNRYIDNLQAHYPNYLPSSYSATVDDYGDFRDENFRPGISSSNRDDPKRALFTQWKAIRCCPRGYNVLWGPSPQLKGMQDFPE